MKDRILKIRKSRGMTQDAFAKKIGLSKNFVWMLEKGERVPSDRTISDICREFNINEKWLRTGEGKIEKEADIDFLEMLNSIGINDPKEREVIEKYHNLTPEDKDLFWQFMERLAK